MLISSRLALMALMLAVIAGCGQSTADRVETARVSAAAAPSRSDSMETNQRSGDSVPARRAEDERPSVEPVRPSWYTWLPPIDSTAEGALAVDSFVRATADPVPVSAEPGGSPFRFDDGDPSRHDAPLIGFPRGALLVVLHGPIAVDGDDWYLVTPAQIAVDIPTGWSPVVAATGSRYLQPFEFACFPSPIEAASLSRATLTDGLPACYGDEEITIVGDLVCEAGPSSIAVGPSWLEAGVCHFDGPPSVFGLDPSIKPGRYAVTGRFLDPEAGDCTARDGDDSTDARLMAVLFCRRAFVATSATPAAP